MTPFDSNKTYCHWNACMARGTEGMELACTGFLEMAKATVKTVIETRSNLDTAAYPIMTLWRHYIELRVKAIGLSLASLHEERRTIQATHDIRMLWDKVRAGIRKEFPDEEPAYLQPITAHIAELSRIDPNSMVFRYTVGLDGQPTLPDDLRYINYVTLAEVIEDVSSRLESVDAGVDVAVEYVNEMRSYYGAD